LRIIGSTARVACARPEHVDREPALDAGDRHLLEQTKLAIARIVGLRATRDAPRAVERGFILGRSAAFTA
jgi:hypothetical protein